MKNITLLFFLIVLVLFNQCSLKNASAPAPDSTSKGGSLSRFAFSSDYSCLYTIDSQNLMVYKLTSGIPEYKHKLGVGSEIETIFILDDRLFIGSTTLLYIYSLGDPENPKAEGQASSQTVMYRCDPVVVKGDVAFSTLRTNSTDCSGRTQQRSILAVYDVEDIKNPIEKATLNLDEPYGLGYAGNTLYVCQRKGFTLIDIESPFKPKIIKTIGEEWYKDVIVHEKLLICWTKNGLKLYDISDKINPTLIATIE